MTCVTSAPHLLPLALSAFLRPLSVISGGVWGEQAKGQLLSFRPDEEAAYEASKPIRDAEKAARAMWKINPINLQEGKDAYRLETVSLLSFPTSPISHRRMPLSQWRRDADDEIANPQIQPRAINLPISERQPDVHGLITNGATSRMVAALLAGKTGYGV